MLTFIEHFRAKSAFGQGRQDTKERPCDCHTHGEQRWLTTDQNRRAGSCQQGDGRGRGGTDLVVVCHDRPLEFGGVYPSNKVLHVPGEDERGCAMERK